MRGEPEIVRAPFSPAQVESLNRCQEADFVHHPFTCGKDSRHVLLATEEGWMCPVVSCGFEQDWAWTFMSDGRWEELLPPVSRVVLEQLKVEIDEDSARHGEDEVLY